MRRPIVHAALCLIAGQILARALPLPATFLWAGFAWCAAAAIWLAARPREPLEPEHSRGALIMALFVLIGALGQQHLDRRQAYINAVHAALDERPIDLEGTVRGAPILRHDGWGVVLKDLQIGSESPRPLPGAILFNYHGEAGIAPPQPGQRLSTTSAIRQPAPPGNPLQFDYRAFLRSRGIAGIAAAYGPAAFATSDPPHVALADRFLRHIAVFKQWAAAIIQTHVGERWTPLMRSLLFGDTFLLDDHQKQTITRTGLAHLMAVSGQHATLIGLLVFAIMRLLCVPWRATWVLTAAIVWLFAALVGMQPPVVRAAVLASALAASQVMRREPDPLNSLALAALIVLLLDPRALYKADFQLSYVCVLAIIVLRPGLSRLILLDTEGAPVHHRIWMLLYNRFIGITLLMSIASQVALLPLLAYHFHQFPIIGLLANVIVLPIAGLAVMLGFVMIFAGGFVPALGALIGSACIVLLSTFEFITEALGSLSWAAIPLAPMPWWAVVLFSVLLLSGSHLRPAAAPGQAERSRAHLLISLSGVAALMICLSIVNRPAGELMVRMLDVGQGDAFFLRFPTGQTMLIDGGAAHPSDRGQRIILPFLRAHGVRRLNVVVASHGDSDHIGGLPAVLREIPVDLVVMGPPGESTATTGALETVIAQKGIPVERVARGDAISGIAPCSLAVLHPGAAYGDDNDLSVVLRLDYGEASFLFTGDATSRAELLMLGAGLDLDCDVLKAGHHGSASSNSAAFLRAVTPEIVLISAGRNNFYRHPHPDALERFENEHARIYRTDHHGSVALFTDGNALRVETSQKAEVE